MMNHFILAVLVWTTKGSDNKLRRKRDISGAKIQVPLELSDHSSPYWSPVAFSVDLALLLRFLSSHHLSFSLPRNGMGVACMDRTDGEACGLHKSRKTTTQRCVWRCVEFRPPFGFLPRYASSYLAIYSVGVFRPYICALAELDDITFCI